LHYCLKEHPEILMPEDETPAFESPDYEENGINELVALSKVCDRSKFGIKRPSYFASAEVAGRIRKHIPGAQLFAVLRNPVDRAVSAYFHNVKYGFIPPLPIERGLKKILSDESFRSRYKRAEEIIRFGHYAEHLSFYESFVEAGRLQLFLHEDVIGNPLACIQSAYARLGVRSDFIPTNLDGRPQSVTYSLARLRFISFFNPLRFRYNSDKTRLSVRYTDAKLTKILRGVDVVDRQILARIFGNRKPSLSADLRASLSSIYSLDAQSVRRALGRNLPDWPREPGSHGNSNC
jgi:hypothetical protein